MIDFQFVDYIVYGLQLLMDFQLMNFQFMDYNCLWITGNESHNHFTSHFIFFTALLEFLKLISVLYHHHRGSFFLYFGYYSPLCQTSNGVESELAFPSRTFCICIDRNNPQCALIQTICRSQQVQGLDDMFWYIIHTRKGFY